MTSMQKCWKVCRMDGGQCIGVVVGRAGVVKMAKSLKV